jgi:hypothetical protein
MLIRYAIYVNAEYVISAQQAFKNLISDPWPYEIR